MTIKATLLAGAALGITAASAQEAGEPVIDEIVVTAQKRPQTVLETPISLTAFGGEFLEDARVDTVSDVATITPNFQTFTGGSQTNAKIGIRGVTSVGNSAIEPSVGVFIDGVYYARPGSVIGNLVDIEAVEVLRGPQGTLFGRNTPVGALNITTRGPEDEPSGLLNVAYGNYDQRDVEAAYGAMVSDTVGFRVASRYTDRDGYGDNELAGEIEGQSNLNLRGKLRFEPTDAFTATLIGDYAEIESGGPIIEILADTVNPVFAGTLAQLYGDSPVTEDSFDRTVREVREDSLDDEQWGITLDLAYEAAGGHRLRSITAYRDWRADVRESVLRLPVDLLPRDSRFATEAFSQELQLISPDDQAIEYVAGLFYYEEDYDIDQSFDAGDAFCVPTIFAQVFQQAVGQLIAAGLDPAAAQAQAQGIAQAQAGQCLQAPQEGAAVSAFEQSLTSYAGYGQATWNASDALSLTLGLRYTVDEKDGAFAQGAPNPFAGAFRATEDSPGLKANDDRLTYFANATYFVTPDTMLFGTVSTGFKSGGFNSEGGSEDLSAGGLRVFGPEDTQNYELGLKTEAAPGLRLGVTLYRTEIDDFQDRSFDGSRFLVRNAGELVQQGVEVDYVWEPVEQFQLFGGASYLDSEFTEFEAASPLPGSDEPQDISGARNTYSPEWQLSNVATWRDRLTDRLGWFARGEWTYVSEQDVGGSTNANPQGIQEGYHLLGGGLGIESADGGWTVDLYAKNLLDEDVCLTIFDQPFGEALGAVDVASNTTAQRCVLNAPRTYGVRVRTNF